jgi:hypothetical protein
MGDPNNNLPTKRGFLNRIKNGFRKKNSSHTNNNQKKNKSRRKQNLNSVRNQAEPFQIRKKEFEESLFKAEFFNPNSTTITNLVTNAMLQLAILNRGFTLPLRKPIETQKMRNNIIKGNEKDYAEARSKAEYYIMQYMLQFHDTSSTAKTPVKDMVNELVLAKVSKELSENVLNVVKEADKRYMFKIRGSLSEAFPSDIKEVIKNLTSEGTPDSFWGHILPDDGDQLIDLLDSYGNYYARYINQGLQKSTNPMFNKNRNFIKVWPELQKAYPALQGESVNTYLEHPTPAGGKRHTRRRTSRKLKTRKH